MDEKIKKAIKAIEAEIREEERNAEEYDEVWGCCDKSLSEGVLDGLQSGLSYLKGLLKNEKVQKMRKRNSPGAKSK